MAEIRHLRTTDHFNATRVDALWPEGLKVKQVNDSGRGLEGLIARWEKDINGSITSIGSGELYALLVNRDLSQGVYDGLEITFRPHVDNESAPRIQTRLSPENEQSVPIVDSFGNPLTAGTLRQGTPARVIWNGVAGVWVLVTNSSTFAAYHFWIALDPGDPPAVVKQSNVGTVDRTGVGTYRLNLQVASANTTSLLQASMRASAADRTRGGSVQVDQPSTSIVVVSVFDAGGNLTDAAERVYVQGVNTP